MQKDLQKKIAEKNYKNCRENFKEITEENDKATSRSFLKETVEWIPKGIVKGISESISKYDTGEICITNELAKEFLK